MDPAVIVALIMAVASIVVALIGKINMTRLHKKVDIIEHQTNAMQDEMQRLAKAEGVAKGRQLQKDENSKGPA